jgi:transforming growth factor-beta-induced protein
MHRWIQALAAVAAAGLLAACGGGGDDSPAATPQPQDTQNLSRALATSGQTATMAGAADAAGLAATLSGNQNYTLLMPNDEAMSPYAEDLAELRKPENRAALEEYVKAHMVEGKVLAAALGQGQSSPASAGASSSNTGTTNPDGSTTVTVKNLLGDDIEITTKGAEVTVNGATFLRRDIVAGNGVLHIFGGPIFRPSVFGIVRVLPQTQTLETAIRTAGLVDTLRGDGPFTLFAPTNDAFDALLRELNLTAEQLLNNKPLLTSVLTYHVLSSRVLARQVQDGAVVPTVQGQAVTFDVGRDGFGQRTIEITDARDRKARVTFTNLRARNGVVHLIDRVILPTDRDIVAIAAANPEFSTLVAAVQAAGLVETLQGNGPFTVFAPTNAAFAGLLQELGLTAEQLLSNKPLLTSVLTYHVLASRSLAASLTDGLASATVQGQPVKFKRMGDKLSIVDARGRESNVAIANVQASNGIVHAIDKVILPTERNLVALAQATPGLSILVEAVVAAGLVETLSAPGAFTVFAPTNDAFAGLLRELGLSKQQLLADKALLTKVLTYHVLPKQVLSSGIPFGQPITTVQGQTFTINRNLRITDANNRRSGIVATDVAASNGVVHVIDHVILPR